MSKLTKVIAAALKIDEEQVFPQLALGDIETWDSLNHIHLVVAIEEAFHVRFETEEIPNLTRVDLIEKALHGKTA